MLDLQIIGGGPAGLSAAMYAARAGLSVRVYDRAGAGGQLLEAAEVENYPGVEKIRGAELAEKFSAGAISAGAEIFMGEVSRAEKKEGAFLLTFSGGACASRALILANGAAPRRLAVPGEREFAGRGVSYCAVCDGRFYGGKTVAVVGGGDSALSEALYLAAITARVHLIHRRADFRGSPALLARLRQLPQVVFHTKREVSEIAGKNAVNSIKLVTREGIPAEEIPVDGVFVAIGRTPDNARFANLSPLNLAGYFPVGEDCETSLGGFFVAGDTREKRLRQLAGAAADGAMAAESARHYLETLTPVGKTF